MDWRKSSYSANGGADCVETASGTGVVLVRGTKDNANGPVLSVTVDAWARFTASLR